jgi:membrane-bound serine protease (ClpP class)
MLKRLILFSWLLMALLAYAGPAVAGAAQIGEGAPLALVLTADGPVSQTMIEYLQRGIQVAERRGAVLIVLQLNTPGGAVDTMTAMVQELRASSVPVVVYVAPRGAMAGSAGTVITLAGHVAAMAPETAIGAASPVGPSGEDLGETLAAKEKNILKATVRSLAVARPPEAVALAEATIESAEAASASEALKVGLVDYVADDVFDLLDQLDGRTVLVLGQEVVLRTASAQVEYLEPTLIEQLLDVLANPNIVFLLISVGVQAILIEISSPGGWVAGFIGVVCLALATYGLGILPVNWFGLVFLVTAFALFLLDIKAPTHGALTVAGTASLIVGALVLFNSPGTPQFQRVSPALVVLVSILTAISFGIIVTFAIRAQRTPVRTGQESLVGRAGVVRSDLSPHGTVQVGGELWSAELERGQQAISKGEKIEVVKVDGIHLRVRKAKE